MADITRQHAPNTRTVILFKIRGLETSDTSEANEVKIPNALAKILMMSTVCSGCLDKTPQTVLNKGSGLIQSSLGAILKVKVLPIQSLMRVQHLAFR